MGSLVASVLKNVTGLSAAEIAKRVGYDVEAAFSKAFNRWIRVAPGAYRRKAETRGDPEFRPPSGGA
jgi:AraC-like DNA-binding protein